MLELAHLKQVDTAVRSHEMAHLAVAGPYAKGGVSFQYKRGPDGRQYAVGGEVQIDISREVTPEETIEKMEVVRAAALAPADPSPQDRKVAAAATSLMGQARQELRVEEMQEAEVRKRLEGQNTDQNAVAEGKDIHGSSGPYRKAAENIIHPQLFGQGNAITYPAGYSFPVQRQRPGLLDLMV